MGKRSGSAPVKPGQVETRSTLHTADRRQAVAQAGRRSACRVKGRMRHLEKNIETVAACPRLLTKAEVSRCSVSPTRPFSRGCARARAPLSIELGPSGGRSTKIAWLADEVYAWIASRPRRKLTPTPIKPNTQPAQRRRGASRSV